MRIVVVYFFSIVLMLGCKPPCGSCPAKQEGNKYRSIRKQALKQEKQMNKQAKKEARTKN